jgi:hypothetical protein
MTAGSPTQNHNNEPDQLFPYVHPSQHEKVFAVDLSRRSDLRRPPQRGHHWIERTDIMRTVQTQRFPYH